MKTKANLSYVLCIIQLIVVIGAIPEGILYLIDPTGHKSGTSTSVLINSPFVDFFFPGLFLLIFIGFSHLSSAIITILKIEVAGFLGILFGIILMIWIILKIHWIGYSSFLQPLFFILGIIEAVTGFILLRRVIRTG